MNEKRINELNERTILLLEITKKEFNKFAQERRKIFQFSSSRNNVDLEKWEEEIKQLEMKLHIA